MNLVYRSKTCCVCRRVLDVLVAALRMLMAQLQLLKVDTANTGILLLARTLPTHHALHYLHAKLAEQYQLPIGDSRLPVGPLALASRLPITAAFGQASPSAAHVAPQVRTSLA